MRPAWACSQRRCDRLLKAAQLAFQLDRIDAVQGHVEEAEQLDGADRQRATG
jgi:hypothetical protein